MFSQYKDEHLSRIETNWAVLFKAHHGEDSSLNNAQALLLQRYCGAVYRYLVAVIGNVNEADELAQEFALRMLQGKFKTADKSKGRFRDYVKTSLFNLVRRHHRNKNQSPGALHDDAPEPAVAEDNQADQSFTEKWRDEVLSNTWESLARYERESGKLFHTFLQYRTQNNTTSEAMAKEFSTRLGKALTPAGVRQTLHRARDRFGDMLIDEVARSLQTQDKEVIEQELADLGLLTFCQDAVKRWKEKDRA